MIRKLLNHLRPAATPQTRPLLDAKTPQVANSAGGYVWTASAWDRLDRFLVLGSEGGTYYVTERKLTIDNLALVRSLLAVDGVRLVDRLVQISKEGRAPRNRPAILALAVAMRSTDLATRRAAHAAVTEVCRTGTHLFELVEAVQALGGWGRGARRAIARWYTSRSADELSFQVLKYAQRDGWTHRDVLRLCHARPGDEAQARVFRFAVKGWTDDLPDVPELARVRAVGALRTTGKAKQVSRLIRDHQLPREVVPPAWLDRPLVWDALLHAGHGMPYTALLRNLATLTRVGLLARGSEATRTVVRRLGEAQALSRARVHPLQLLLAHEVYKAGKGLRSKTEWKPVPEIVAALDRAFHASFQHVPTTGKRWMLALDVSGSMGWSAIAGMEPITPRVASAAMAMITRASEPDALLAAFSTGLSQVDLPRKASLTQVLDTLGRFPMGGTDCALPMQHALKHRTPVDVFVIYTDSETWHGQQHPMEALRRYRDAMGIRAKLIVVGMTSTGFTIADPDDLDTLDIVGFDTAAPRLMADLAVR
jgi:60 kDa SS-A/Ro ribonucleoprotein